MPRKFSAGLLMYRRGPTGIEVFLVHPGGPLFAHKDAGAWSAPKGEVEEGEVPLDVAQREFTEETGQSLEACGAAGPFVPLGSVVQRGGKTVEAWAFAGDWPAGAVLHSNGFAMEWPPGSGRRQEFPEVDRGEFFEVERAREKINPVQATFLDRLLERLELSGPRVS